MTAGYDPPDPLSTTDVPPAGVPYPPPAPPGQGSGNPPPNYPQSHTGYLSPPPTAPSRDPLGIAGFVLALLGWTTFGTTLLPGLICSIIAYKNREQYGGKTLMLWGFWLNIAAFAIIVLIIVLLVAAAANSGGGSYGGSV
jgi:hypothetical protein